CTVTAPLNVTLEPPRVPPRPLASSGAVPEKGMTESAAKAAPGTAAAAPIVAFAICPASLTIVAAGITEPSDARTGCVGKAEERSTGMEDGSTADGILPGAENVGAARPHAIKVAAQNKALLNMEPPTRLLEKGAGGREARRRLAS